MWTTLQPDVVCRLPRHGSNGAGHPGIATAEPHHSANEEWEKRIANLEAFKTYKNDWDGQGAEALTNELVQSAIHLANVLRQANIDVPSCVLPGVNGTIIFEWQDADGAYLEIEVTEPYHADACLIVPGQPTEHWTLQ